MNSLVVAIIPARIGLLTLLGNGNVVINIGFAPSKPLNALINSSAAFLAETDGVTGVTQLGVGGLAMYYGTEEAVEGKNAFIEKRKADFNQFRKK